MNTTEFINEISNLNRRNADLEARVLQLNARINELLEANNKYLERARAAERKTQEEFESMSKQINEAVCSRGKAFEELAIKERLLHSTQLEKVSLQRRLEQAEKDLREQEKDCREEIGELKIALRIAEER